MSIEDTLARLTAAAENQVGAVTALASAVTALTAVVTGRSMARAEGPDESAAPAVPTAAPEVDSARIAATPIAPAAAPAAIAPTPQSAERPAADDERARPATPVNPAFTEKNTDSAEKKPNCEAEKCADARADAEAVKAEQAPGMTMKEFAEACKGALAGLSCEQRGAACRRILTLFGAERLFAIPEKDWAEVIEMLRAEAAALGAN